MRQELNRTKKMPKIEPNTNSKIGLLALIWLGVATILSCGEKTAETRPEDDHGPRLVMSETAFDFGDLYYGDQSRHVFEIKNEGQEVLKILDHKKECGCTAPIFDREEIPPQESAKMTVVFKSPPLGQVAKRLWIFSNDPYNKSQIVTLKARGLGPVRVEPSVIRLDQKGLKEPLYREITLTLPPGSQFTKINPVSPNPWLKLDVESEMGTRHATLKLEILSPHEPMDLREVLTVMLTVRNKRGETTEFSIPRGIQVLGSLAPAQGINPPVLHLGNLAKGERRTVKFSEFNSAGPALKIAESFAADAFQIRMTRLESGSYELQLEPKQNCASGRHFLKIPLVGPQGQHQLVPVHAWVAKS